MAIEFSSFFSRKATFLKNVKAVVVFPGGVGTLDELFEVLLAIRAKKIQSIPIYLIEKNLIHSHDLVFEFMLNTTRLETAIPYTLFTEQTGLDIKRLIPKLKQAEQRGFLNCTQTHWQVTPFGRRFTNDLQHLFLPS